MSKLQRNFWSAAFFAITSCIVYIASLYFKISIVNWRLSASTKDHANKHSFLLTSIKNQMTGKIVTCNPTKYKYFKLLLDEMHSYFDIMKQKRIKHTTDDIDQDMNRLRQDGAPFHRRERIQIIDGHMYVSNNKYFKYGNDREGYTTSILLYLKSLMTQYSQSIDDTDFIWHYHDVKVRDKYFGRYKWKNNHTVPYFFSDANIVWNDNNQMTNILFAVSRNYCKYKHFADTVFDHWKMHKNKYNQGKRVENITTNGLLTIDNYGRIKDYLEFKEIEQNKAIHPLFDWKSKQRNKALFVGGNAGKIRPKFFEIMLNDSYIFNLTKDYFDIHRGFDGMSIFEQLRYKFLIVLDGNSVRDGFFYQLGFNTVILKQLSSFYEFWIFDLVNNEHVIFFENILHLISIVINMVDQVNEYYVNGQLNAVKTQKEFEYFTRNDIVHSSDYTPMKLEKIAQNAQKFADEYLNEESVDCFMINMLRLYNHYLFDISSMHKANTKMTKLNLSD